MDILSILLFFIYSLIILVILVYISPLLSALIMILVPVASVYILPEETISFLTTMQFSYAGVQIYNLHILLLIWSAFIGIIAYAEVLTWYLLRETIVKETVIEPVKKEALPIQGGQPETLFFKVKDFLEKLIKILKGEKIKAKP